MVEQIRVSDLARNLIRLSGFVPGDEIPIRYIGLRPGEKLYEELVGDGEIAEPSGMERILRVRTTDVAECPSLEDKLMTLEAAGHLKNSGWMMEQLRELIPTFRSHENEGIVGFHADEELAEGTAVRAQGP
jgi:FlaA1/EpsC-like NDP-sugar epimerase